jgi:hypothetical protein
MPEITGQGRVQVVGEVPRSLSIVSLMHRGRV